MDPDWAIVHAAPEHVPGVVAVADACRLDPDHPGTPPQRGFLVSAFTRDDYLRFVDRADHFYVLVRPGDVLGFVLGWSGERAQPGDWLAPLVRSRHTGPFVVVKQVGVRPASGGRGLATALYEHLVGRTRGRALFAAIVLEPRNGRSIALHERCGFHQAFEATPPDGRRRGVWMRPAPQ